MVGSVTATVSYNAKISLRNPVLPPVVANRIIQTFRPQNVRGAPQQKWNARVIVLG